MEGGEGDEEEVVHIAPVVVELSKRNCKLLKATGKASGVWKHFMLYPLKLGLYKPDEYPVCIHCYEKFKDNLDVNENTWEVKIGSTHSTSHLDKHIQRTHPELHKAENLVRAAEKGGGLSNWRVSEGSDKSEKCMTDDIMAAAAELHAAEEAVRQGAADDVEVQPVKRRRINDDLFSLLGGSDDEDVEAVEIPGMMRAENELVAFKLEAVLPHSKDAHGDPLAWWKDKATHYPLLSRVARRLLNIPATSASSERTFSTSGNVISKKRARLTPGTASAIVFLYSNWDLVDNTVAERELNDKH
jgi:hypothetical protein